MTSLTEVKLLTLLNVTAIKRPRDLDKPGGYRASPVLSRTSSLQPSLNGDAADGAIDAPASSQPNGNGDGQPPAKKRKSVIFGGELGPSGSTYKDKEKSDGKRKASSGAANGSGKAGAGGKANGDSKVASGIAPEFLGLADLAEASDDEDAPAASSSATALSSNDLWATRYDATSSVLQSDLVASAEKHEWSSEAMALQGYGRAVESRPGSSSSSSAQQSDKSVKTRITPALLASLEKVTPEPLTSTCLNHLGTYKDFYLHSMDGEADGTKRPAQEEHVRGMRQAVVVHALNHVLKTRKRIVRNNERLAHQAAADPNSVPEPPRDQSFTRPKVLFLLPLRSKALTYLKDNIFPLAPAGTQIENRNPFLSSFGTGNDNDEDDESGNRAGVPLDRIEDFHGNSDDNFRFGIKITRKAWRVVMPPANEEKLMECDLLFASPLGMKMMSEKEDDSTDLLSSIEVCVADGCDVMNMQNWDHVQFVFEHMNEIPRAPHGCDFSRVKPWYLEGQAKYLRQTILMSRYDMPETRAIFSKHCHNLAGKVRLDTPSLPGVLGRVKPGVRQVFDRIDAPAEGGRGESAVDEVERRLEFFTKKTIPDLLRSAVSRQKTIVIVPSYFDYVRLMNYLRKNDVVTYAAISEYSSDSEISRARVTFFKGKKDFLFVTERLHFYRRYKIRGAQTFVFYSPPEHAQYYAEFLETPFLPSRKAVSPDEAQTVEPEDVRSVTLYSKFDRLRMERIVGKGMVGQMYSGEARYEFE